MKIQIQQAPTHLFPVEMALNLVGCVVAPVADMEGGEHELPEDFRVGADSLLAAVQEWRGDAAYEELIVFLRKKGYSIVNTSVSFELPSRLCRVVSF